MSDDHNLGSPSFVNKVQQKLFKMTLFTKLNAQAQSVKANGKPSKKAKEVANICQKVGQMLNFQMLNSEKNEFFAKKKNMFAGMKCTISRRPRLNECTIFAAKEGRGHHRLVLGLLGLEVREEPRQGRDLLLPLRHRRRGLRCRVPNRAVTLEEDEGRIRRGKKTKRS